MSVTSFFGRRSSRASVNSNVSVSSSNLTSITEDRKKSIINGTNKKVRLLSLSNTSFIFIFFINISFFIFMAFLRTLVANVLGNQISDFFTKALSDIFVCEIIKAWSVQDKKKTRKESTVAAQVVDETELITPNSEIQQIYLQIMSLVYHKVRDNIDSIFVTSLHLHGFYFLCS